MGFFTSYLIRGRMNGRLVVVLGFLLALPTVAPIVSAVHEDGGAEIVVVVIDTGVHPTHQEFDYRGATSTSDQFVAWFDFTAEAKPASRTDPFQIGQPLWDPDVPTPFDGNGHGTGTASLVGGRNLGSCGGGNDKISYAPGVKLGIAKVGTADGTIAGDIATAVRWANEVVHADVISMSIGSIVPFPNLDDDAFEEFRLARQAGALVVVSAGNGLANAGQVPYPSETANYGSSLDVFAVGGGTRSGATTFSRTGNTDPDVSGWSDSVCAAVTGTTNAYTPMSGTSFSTPLVAGMAARAMELAVANGEDATPDHVADILRHCATDTMSPYAREGWGFLGTPNQPCIATGASTGTVPAYAPFGGVDLSSPYDANVRTPLRDAWSTPVPTSGFFEARLPLPATTPVGVLGPSLPTGAFEVEAIRYHVPAGQTLSVHLAYAGDVANDAAPDIDLALVRGDDFASGLTLASQRLDASGNPGGLDEELSWTARADTDVVLMVIGWALTEDQPYTLTASLASSGVDQGLFTGAHVA